MPPQTRIVARARTARARKSSSGRVSVPLATRSSAENPRRRKRRIVSAGPSSASGGSTTFTREPSGSRASHSGSASSARRPSGARIRSIASRRSASRSKRTPVASSRPRRSTHTGAVPETMISSTAGSASSGSSGPSPNARSRDPRDQLVAPLGAQHAGLAIDERADPPGKVVVSVRTCAREQPLAQVGGEGVEGVHAPDRRAIAVLAPSNFSRRNERSLLMKSRAQPRSF